MTITHHFVAANGMRLHVVEAGRDGPPVLLLHGYPQHSYAWRHVMAVLVAQNARDLRVRVVDGGHYLPEEHPAQVAAAIREMSNRVPTPQSSVNERNNPT